MVATYGHHLWITMEGTTYDDRKPRRGPPQPLTPLAGWYAMTVPPSPEGHGPVCGAKKRQGTGSCRQVAGFGTDHVGHGPCKFQGGSTPTVSRGAHRQAAQAKAHALVAAEGLEPVTDPIAVMTMLAAESIALVVAFRAMVADLDDYRYSTKTGEQLRAEVALYERALDRAEKFANNLARLGLEERVVRVTESQVHTLASMVGEVLDAPELALSPEQVGTARKLLAERARALVGTA